MFSVRFDLRAATADHYAAALDMAEWADAHGAVAVSVPEHHGSPDGYLPAPLVMAGAIAARTSRVAIQVAALIVPLRDPIQLAEELAVLDLLSGGRLSYICAAGYRSEEYEMAGRPMAGRGHRLEEAIGVLRQAWTGEPFTFEGRPCQVTPRPISPGGPMLFMGGGTPAAARRAARLGLGMITERTAGLEAVYLDTCEQHGTTPQLFIEVPNDTVATAFVAEDPDSYWDEVAPYVLHDASMYQRWSQAAGKDAAGGATSAETTIEGLRRVGHPYRVFTPAEAVAHVRAGHPFSMHPLVGGLPPEVGWRSLQLFASEVLPQLV